ncbi:TetR/AcrR family transcriptional regulator [Streptomyces zagrosensis]|uniref:AcrR family transcriptional regulator n=1 Tax=Streptomyces zagrosensis TaxID=1042984 RepID=A0A7W9QHH0_9ACTN|nr:TetR/AcrR family transcriptional regulator [Streptomyces zagrosensis]MBB5940281.1 AcrR family transcriptional regulator [Streptomyces zagrosensis]
MDNRFLDAAVTLMDGVGWDSVTLQAVADKAGVSRATLWRQVGGKDALREALLHRLSRDYRDALWPVLTAEGTGRERLRRALEQLCSVLDRHLPLLAAFDTAFHDAPSGDSDELPTGFVQPLARLVRDGVADGSLHPPTDCEQAASLVFNAVCWPYVHLRRHHAWPPDEARRLLLDLVLKGVS